MEFYVSRENTDESLQHYGILGMRWGVWRYQNEDGSLKPAGKERYGVNKPGLKEAKTQQIKIK